MLRNWQKVSKFLSYLLRHNPERFGLELDAYGFADLDRVIAVLNNRFGQMDRRDLFDLVQKDAKGRFQIEADKIRAAYGHSIEVKPLDDPVQPPEQLYHGTSPTKAVRIRKQGLKPMGRQFVHLSCNKAAAFEVGKRHDRQPVIIRIQARKAWQEGISFYKAANTYLVKFVAPQYLELCTS